MSKDSPCMGCLLRHKGCHAGCDDYLAYTEEKEKERAAEKADREPYNIGRDVSLTKFSLKKKRYNSNDS